MLTKKYGPLPGWAWLGIIVVGVYIYRKKAAASTAATGATTGSTTATGVPTETLSYPNGGSYSGPVGYSPPGLGGSTPGNTGSTFTPPAGAIQAASGAYYAPLTNQKAAQEVTQGGGTLYAQPTPGNFVALPKSGGPTGIPLYAAVGGSPVAA
jgi:hypothetical protein